MTREEQEFALAQEALSRAYARHNTARIALDEASAELRVAERREQEARFALRYARQELTTADGQKS